MNQAMRLPDHVAFIPPAEEACHSGAILSDCRHYRYLLWRVWGDIIKSRYALFIGLNPSTADEDTDDQTIRKCVGYAKKWGFAGLVMANLFAYRSRNPALLKRVDDPIGPENDRYLSIQDPWMGAAIAAWGTHGNYLDRDRAVCRLVSPLKCLVVTEGGFPAHPLYLGGSLYPFPFKPRVGS